MTSASDPRALLRELEQRARKRFGQHFLARPSVCDVMVRAAGVVAGDRVVEIGPGLGVLTEPLLGAGAAVTAIEIDDDLAERTARVYPEVRLVHADATGVDWASLCDGEGWKLVANLPYNVGTGLVLDLARMAPRFRSLTVMLQAEVIERFCASPSTKAYGAITVQLALRGTIRPVIAVPPEAFVPPPKVRSAVVHIDLFETPRTEGIDPALVDRVVVGAFSQRRKTLRNSLGALLGKDAAEAALRAAGIDPGKRAEVLGPADFVAIARAVQG